MLIAIWGFFSLIIFFLYPHFFSREEMWELSAMSFFFKRLFASILFGGFILVFVAMLFGGNV